MGGQRREPDRRCSSPTGRPPPTRRSSRSATASPPGARRAVLLDFVRHAVADTPLRRRVGDGGRRSRGGGRARDPLPRGSRLLYQCSRAAARWRRARTRRPTRCPAPGPARPGVKPSRGLDLVLQARPVFTACGEAEHERGRGTARAGRRGTNAVHAHPDLLGDLAVTAAARVSPARRSLPGPTSSSHARSNSTIS